MREFEFRAIILAEDEDEAWDKMDANDFEEYYLEETLESKRVERYKITKERIKQFVSTETGKMIADYMKKYNQDEEKDETGYRLIAKKYEEIADIVDYMEEHKEDIPEGCEVYCDTYRTFTIIVNIGDGIGMTWYFSESTMEESMKKLENDY